MRCPELTDADMDQENSDELSQIYLDPYEYRDLLVCGGSLRWAAAKSMESKYIFC
jgi:hypothetical protein